MIKFGSMRCAVDSSPAESCDLQQVRFSNANTVFVSLKYDHKAVIWFFIPLKCVQMLEKKSTEKQIILETPERSDLWGDYRTIKLQQHKLINLHFLPEEWKF